MNEKLLLRQTRNREAELRQAKVDVKKLRRLKGDVSRQFSTAHCDEPRLAELKHRMSEIRSQLIQAEARVKELLRWDSHQQVDELDEFRRAPERFIGKANPGSAPLDLNIRFADLADDSDWNAYVHKHERATPYHDSRWREVICGALRQRSISLLALSDGKVVGILPMYRLTSRLFGDFGVSTPYVNYGGALGDNEGIEDALLREAAALVPKLSLDFMEVREFRVRRGWSHRSNKVSMIRPLPETIQRLDRELGSKIRAQIKRGAKAGFCSTFGGSELLDDFYHVFARNMRDLGTPVYSKTMFDRILSCFPDMFEVLVVRSNSTPVAAALLLKYRNVMEIPWASSLRETNTSGSNMYMYWAALCRTVESKCDFFDFGRSTRDSGTFRFKRQWGAYPIEHVWNYSVPSGTPLPSLNPDSNRYRHFVRIWKTLPLVLTRLVGPHIVRNLP